MRRIPIRNGEGESVLQGRMLWKAKRRELKGRKKKADQKKPRERDSIFYVKYPQTGVSTKSKGGIYPGALEGQGPLPFKRGGHLDHP